jgi:hypothetical protein
LVIGTFAQEAAALVRPQPGIQAGLRQQAAMIAFLDNAAAVQHHQPIHRSNCRETVGDGDHALGRQF